MDDSDTQAERGDDPSEGDDLPSEELADTSAVLGAAMGDLVDTSALARLTGTEHLWSAQMDGVAAALQTFAQVQQQWLAEAVPGGVLAGQRRFLEEFQRTLSPVSGIVEAMRSALLPTAAVLDQFIERIKANRPPNWPIGDEALGFEELSAFVQETCWPVIWVPEAAVVTALVSAPVAERDRILLAHEATILKNCADALAECSGSVVAELVPHAVEAVTAAQAGHPRAAQALAAALITTVLEVHLEFPSLARAARDLSFDVDELSFDRARIGYILCCVPQSLSQFGDRAGGAPVPSTFNRHATLHHVCDVQYTPRNALVSLMLASALLRELDELDRTNRLNNLFTDT